MLYEEFERIPKIERHAKTSFQFFPKFSIVFRLGPTPPPLQATPPCGPNPLEQIFHHPLYPRFSQKFFTTKFCNIFLCFFVIFYFNVTCIVQLCL